jgi:hypothetical protein
MGVTGADAVFIMEEVVEIRSAVLDDDDDD